MHVPPCTRVQCPWKPKAGVRKLVRGMGFKMLRDRDKEVECMFYEWRKVNNTTERVSGLGEGRSR